MVTTATAAAAPNYTRQFETMQSNTIHSFIPAISIAPLQVHYYSLNLALSISFQHPSPFSSPISTLGVFALGVLLSGIYCERRYINLEIRYSTRQCKAAQMHLILPIPQCPEEHLGS